MVEVAIIGRGRVRVVAGAIMRVRSEGDHAWW